MEQNSVRIERVIRVSRRNGKDVYYDTVGREICQPKYDEVEWFSNGYARVEIDDKFGFINRFGKEICPIEYDDAECFGNDGYARVKLGSHWGSMNEAGEVEWEAEEVLMVCNWPFIEEV